MASSDDFKALPSIEILRDKLLESVPYCSGTLVPDSRSFLLYYGKEPSA